MPLVSVPAIFDGKQIQLLEDAPVSEPYRVLVTFVEPAAATPISRDLARFQASLGSWQDERPIEATLNDIRNFRRSRKEPPAL